MNNSHFLKIGTIARPHGLKGEVELFLYSGSDTILDIEMNVYLSENEKLEVESIRIGNKILVFFKGIHDRTYWEKAKLPLDIYFKKSEMPALNEDECYIYQLIDLNLVSIDGEKLGRVSGHYTNGAQDILQLIFVNGERMDLPYIKPFFPKFNIKEGWLQFLKPEILE